jgi:hypothetical protein
MNTQHKHNKTYTRFLTLEQVLWRTRLAASCAELVFLLGKNYSGGGILDPSTLLGKTVPLVLFKPTILGAYKAN